MKPRLLTLMLVTLAPAAVTAQVAQDTSFHAMQMRGRLVMGVDQYASTHVFEDAGNGGRIELQLEKADADGVTIVRRHLQTIRDAFAQGDFTAPALVHMKEVAGAKVMAERRKLIRYEYRDRPRGGELVIRTDDQAAREAIHAFLAFQRSEHHRH